MAMSYYCVRLTLGENIKIQKQTVPSFICPIFSFPFFFDVVLTLEIGVVRKASEVFNTNPLRDSPRGGNKPHYRYERDRILKLLVSLPLRWRFHQILTFKNS